MKKTVAQILPSLISGGVERETIEIAKGLVKNNYKSLVISSGGSLVCEVRENMAEHITMPVASKNPFIIWKNVYRLQQLIKDRDIKLLHARSRAPAWSTYYACSKADIPFVTTVHGTYSTSPALKKIYNQIMLKGDAVIAISHFIKNYILQNYKVDESKIVLIPRGVDTDYFNPEAIDKETLKRFKAKYKLEESRPVILLPGRFTSWKGHELLVQSINKIKNLDFACIMVGDDVKDKAYVKRVDNLINSYNLREKIKLFGSEHNMLYLYAISDIVVSSSTRPEAFGRVAVEAQAMKKIVIGSNIGGSTETIIDEKTGLLFDNQNIDDLADKISYSLKLLESRLHEEMGNNARENVVLNYHLKQMQDQTIEVYKTLL